MPRFSLELLAALPAVRGRLRGEWAWWATAWAMPALSPDGAFSREDRALLPGSSEAIKYIKYATASTRALCNNQQPTTRTTRTARTAHGNTLPHGQLIANTASAMPPRKAKKPPAPPLAGYSIAISGTFAGTNQTAVQGTIASLGATVAKSVTSDTHVLVSTPADVKKGSKKVQDAQSAAIPIVSLDWLDECATSQQQADLDDFLLVSNTSSAPTPAPAPAPAANAKGKGKKRAASPDPASAPVHKTAKVAPPANTPKLEPKVGEGSILKSRNINIPLDEGCPLQTYQVYVDDDGIVYDASLNQTNASHNNNKFYRVQVR